MAKTRDGLPVTGYGPTRGAAIVRALPLLSDDASRVTRNTTLTILLITASLTSPPTAIAGELIDPTKPPAALTAPAAGTEEEGDNTVAWKLTATFTTGRGNRAVINGRHVKVGDTVRDAEVLSIRPGQVQLRGGEEVFTLTIVTDSIRRPATGIILSL